jgi:cell division FtsZ-interacting protein ZapD
MDDSTIITIYIEDLLKQINECEEKLKKYQGVPQGDNSETIESLKLELDELDQRFNIDFSKFNKKYNDCQEKLKNK